MTSDILSSIQEAFSEAVSETGNQSIVLGAAVCQHPIPEDWAFEEAGMIVKGGICPACGTVVRGESLGSMWAPRSKGTHAELNRSFPDLKILGPLASLRIEYDICRDTGRDFREVMEGKWEQHKKLGEKPGEK